MIPPLALLPVTAWFTAHAGLYGTAAIAGGFTGIAAWLLDFKVWRYRR